MRKVYLVKSLILMVVGIIVASCNKMDFGEYQTITEEQIKENAEKALGVTIDPNQTWVMTQNVTANVTFNGDYGTEGTAIIYENDPSIDQTGVVLGKASVESGNTATFKFTAPTGTSLVYAAVVDHLGYTYVKPVTISNAKVTASFGDGTTASAARRSSTNSNVNIPTGASKSSIQTLAAEILAKSVELNDDNNGSEGNTPGSYWYNSETDKGITKNNNYVINYLISNTYEGLVTHLGTVGYEWTGEWAGNAPAYNLRARTAYVKGKWTIPAGYEQKCGQGADGLSVDGIIIVDNNAELVVNGSLKFVNQGRLIVLPGGKITGTGSIDVTNGAADGEESYNFGTISVKQLNQNFGNFFNYGIIDSETLIGGAGTSCFVNHGKINVKEAYGNGKLAANLQIKNNCWFEASSDIYCKIIENSANSYIKCNYLEMSAGEGGKGLASYMAVDAGSRVYVVGNLKGNNTSIIGPTSGNYAYICIGGEVQRWNWSNDSNHSGMIINNIYLYATPDSQTEWNWTHMKNETVLDTNPDWAANWGSKIGNGHVETLTTMDGYNTAITEATECAPSFTPPDPDPVVDTYPVYSYAFEDTKVGDYDMNDVVIKAQETEDGKINLKLVAVGATLDLNIRLYPAGTITGSEVAHYSGEPTVLSYNNQTEIHAMLGVNKGTMTNTGAGATANPITIQIDKGSYDPAHLPLAIYSESQGEMRLAGSGQAPFGVIIPIDWKWPTERVNITSAYNNVDTDEGDQSFGTFANKTGEALNWYKYPTGSVMIK